MSEQADTGTPDEAAESSATTAPATATSGTVTASAAPAAPAAKTPAAPVARGSVFDDLWARVTSTPRLRVRTEWILLGVVTLLAAVLRFWNLGGAHFLIFDETFYVKDAWTLLNLGYEAEWPENPNDAFNAGDPNGYTTDPSYVVHPPLGKYLIGLGMLVFGADNPFGWRFAVALLGTLAVPLLWVIAKKLFRSPVLATIGAGMLTIDGHAIVMSRVGILDGILMFFVLLAFLFVLLDREDQQRKLRTKIMAWRAEEGLDGDPIPTKATTTSRAPDVKPVGPDWGPRLWWRPWLMAAAVTLGAASAVKWSGLYFLAAFCIYTLVVDMIERKRLGVTFWGSAAILMQGPVSFLLTVPLAALTYLATWTRWLTTTGGFYRGWAEEAGNAWTGLLSWVPLPLQSLWHYQVEAYNFHRGLSAEHPYQSGPQEWPFLIRPTAFSYVYSEAGDGSSCDVGQCVEAITSISNPIIFWFGTVSILFLIIMCFLRPKWQYFAILVGYGAGYFPWLAYLERQAVFHFYAIAFLPFMILASLVVIQTIAGDRETPRPSRTIGVSAVGVLLVIMALVSVLFWPVWTGQMISTSYWSLTHWLPSWR
ncbi:dolichyl-phosphate-mannose--protein mannosyltransferase [Pseudoclavibacter sp. 8L]|uniref:dolichyl-phosphate-mannose--protein mannosyltransferase n=1 Tax=Pseudoclavibacter sp. 8L TaxID=2653162 RepID=UPI0012EF3061|nr:phospholipid carrier-dependent glycosyltransferase [Pseudoclavibacter sp. 8L]VXB68927.1 Phospholipid carrier-dependent glycosyltransferase [Pseudoclavibacter sp. 8L]